MSRRAAGFATWSQEGREVRACETVACAHCGNQRNTHAPDGRKIADDDLGGWCVRCAAYVCGPCADLGKCQPFQKRLDLAERGTPGALTAADIDLAVARQQQRERIRRY